MGFYGGIIPAYAGSTEAQHALADDGRDHPRVCGEHAPRRCDQSQALGSSPRMRGARPIWCPSLP